MSKKLLQMIGLGSAGAGTLIVALAYFMNENSLADPDVVGANIGAGIMFLLGAFVLFVALLSLGASLFVKK